MTIDLQKQKAALEAVALIHTNMVVGLGTGSTAAHFVDALAKRVISEQLKLMCVPTSQQTRLQAERLGLSLVGVEDVPQIDLTVDGADEIGPHLSLIKGGGGALLREKIVAYHSHEFVIIADHTKQVAVLGAFSLPVEIIPFGWAATVRAISKVLENQGLSPSVHLRHTPKGDVFKTDNGNLIVDLALGAIQHPETLAHELQKIPGVVEHGLFLHLAKQAFIAHETRIDAVTA